MGTHIYFRKETEQALIYIPFGTNLADAAVFAGQILPYTTASIPLVCVTERAPLESDEKSGATQDLSLKALVFLRRASDNRLYALPIHSPLMSACFNDKQQVTADAGEALAGYYSTLAGETFVFAHGALVS